MALDIITLASLTGTGTDDLTGDWIHVGEYGVETLLVQVAVGTSVTSIAVQGRISSSFNPYTLWSTATDADSAEVAVYPEMRAVITNASGLCVCSGVVRRSK